MDYEFSLKELYDLKLKATYPMEIGDRSIESGEIIAYFDKIQVANFDEITKKAVARGGFDNRGYVFWESTKEIQFSFVQGIFSASQYVMFINSKIGNLERENITLTQRELKESDEFGSFMLKEIPSGNIFVYDKDTGTKINFSNEGRKITIDSLYKEVIVDYQFEYTDNAQVYNIGQKLFKGFIELEGRTKIKEDITGKVRTGIIKIPKLKIVSNLSLRLGKSAAPMTGSFGAIAVPDGTRGSSKVMEFYLLEDDIDSDI